MAKKVEFTHADVGKVEPLFEWLHEEPSRWERITGNERWLKVEPVPPSGDFDVSMRLSPDGMKLVVNTTKVPPGEAFAPKLAERGVRTPTGWQLVTDVGWVLGWLAPSATPLSDLLDFGFRVADAVGSPGMMWKATQEKRTPDPATRVRV
jgi:hypothetical protein